MNKFAKYVPEEDKKKQREHIGAIGVGDVPTIKAPTYITWDGNRDDRSCRFVGMLDGVCHVSNVIFEDYKELIGKKFKYMGINGEVELTLSEDMLAETDSDFRNTPFSGMGVDGYAFNFYEVVRTNGHTEDSASTWIGVVTSSTGDYPTGVWFAFDENSPIRRVTTLEYGSVEVPDPSYWSSMGINKVLTVTEKLDPPDGIYITWDGYTSEREGGIPSTQGEAYWKVSDYVPSKEEIMGWTFEANMGFGTPDDWRTVSVAENLLEIGSNYISVQCAPSSGEAWVIYYDNNNSYGYSPGIYSVGTDASDSDSTYYTRRIGNATPTKVVTDINDPDTPITFNELLAMVKAGAYVKMYISESPDGPPFTVVAQLINFDGNMITFFVPSFWFYINLYPNGVIETFRD